MFWLAYKLTIRSQNGRTVTFNHGSGLSGNLDPISGVEVEISTSQGVNQIGESITDQTVGSVVRTLSGECLSVAAAKALLQALPPLSGGQLILNDRYACQYVVKRSPYLVRTPGSRNGRTFSALLQCSLPYWQSVDSVSCMMGGYVPSFRFPVNYSTSHRFGTRNPGAFVNVLNPGDFRTSFEAVFAADTTVKDPSLLNCVTGAKLRLLTTLEPGQTFRVCRVNNQLQVTKTAQGQTTDAFACLDDDSSLFYLEAGDNLLKIEAESGTDALRCSVTFRPAYMGVYPDDF